MQPRSHGRNFATHLLAAGVAASLAWAVIASSAAAQSPAAPAPVTVSETEAKPAGGVAISDAATRRLFGGTAEAPDQVSSSSDASPLSTGGIFDLVIRLLAVSAAIYGVVWLLRKWMHHNGGPALIGGRVRVLETVGLASNRLLYVVDLGDKLLLVGATPQQLSLLSEITDERSIAALRGTSNTDEAPRRSLPFGEYLRQLSTRMGRMKASIELPDPALNSRQSLTAQRLRDHREAMRRRRFEVFGEPTDSALIERAS